jgi:hypothetical protein
MLLGVQPVRLVRGLLESESLSNIPDLSDEQWDELLERLTYHASCRLARLRWRGVRSGPPPGGVEAADFASKAMELVILGQRAWDRSAYPDFAKFMKSVIDSRISSLVRSIENRTTRRIGRPGASDEGAAAYEFSGYDEEPIELDIQREDAEAFRAAVIKALDGDEQAFQVFECLEADITKPAEIAEYLGVPVKEINNVQKRLRRKLNDLRPKGKGGRPWVT